MECRGLPRYGRDLRSDGHREVEPLAGSGKPPDVSP